MSAAALMDWMGQNMPNTCAAARACCSPREFHNFMLSLTGLLPIYGEHDAVCAAYLRALMDQQVVRPITTTAPAPRLPPEIWNTRPFDAAAAWAATRIAAGNPEVRHG